MDINQYNMLHNFFDNRQKKLSKKIGVKRPKTRAASFCNQAAQQQLTFTQGNSSG